MKNKAVLSADQRDAGPICVMFWPWFIVHALVRSLTGTFPGCNFTTICGPAGQNVLQWNKRSCCMEKNRNVPERKVATYKSCSGRGAIKWNHYGGIDDEIDDSCGDESGQER